MGEAIGGGWGVDCSEDTWCVCGGGGEEGKRGGGGCLVRMEGGEMERREKREKEKKGKKKKKKKKKPKSEVIPVLDGTRPVKIEAREGVQTGAET